MKFFLKYWLPLLIWLGVIFVGSTNVMSAEHTSRYIVPFLLWLKPGMSPRQFGRFSSLLANARTSPNTRFWLFCYGEHFATFQFSAQKR